MRIALVSQESPRSRVKCCWKEAELGEGQSLHLAECSAMSKVVEMLHSGTGPRSGSGVIRGWKGKEWELQSSPGGMFRRTSCREKEPGKNWGMRLSTWTGNCDKEAHGNFRSLRREEASCIGPALAANQSGCVGTSWQHGWQCRNSMILVAQGSKFTDRPGHV